MDRLSSLRVFMLDMDGTIYLGDRLFPCTLPFLSYLRSTGRRAVYLTNNSSRSRDKYVTRLASFGIDASPDDIFTSGEATTLWLSERAPGAHIYLAGTPSLEREFEDAGFTLTAKDPSYFVLGFDQTLTYEKLTLICNLVRSGIPYIATHPDFNCPVEGGFIPDIGATIAYIEASTGRRPDVVIGKPNRTIAEMAMRKYGAAPEELAMVGDRLYTDIALGANAGIASILVYSGETTREDYQASSVRADFDFEDLAGLQRALEEAGR